MDDQYNFQRRQCQATEKVAAAINLLTFVVAVALVFGLAITLGAL